MNWKFLKEELPPLNRFVIVFNKQSKRYRVLSLNLSEESKNDSSLRDKYYWTTSAKMPTYSAIDEEDLWLEFPNIIVEEKIEISITGFN